MSVAEVERLHDVPPEFPPGWDAARILKPLRTPTAWQPGSAGAAYRRGVTQQSPMLFALLYFGDRLTDPDGHVYLTDMHMDLCLTARGWRDPTGADRVGVIGPRNGGKTVWTGEILPAWCIAQGWWRFPHSWSYTAKQAKGTLANLRRHLDLTPRLLDDFPELRPARGRGTANRQERLDMEGGSIAAAGLSETVLGARSGNDRPGPFILDDCEPLKGHTPKLKRQLLEAITREILPANDRAPVVIAGTTTMYNAIAHDLVRAGRPDARENWPAQHRFRTVHWPALITDPATGAQRSLWPRRWPLAQLLDDQRRDPDGFALNMACDPSKPGGPDGVTYWTPDLIRYDPRALPDELVVAVDVAVTRNERSDYTTLCVVGLERARRRAVIVHAEQGRYTLLELQERLWELKRANPTLRRGVLETNQGGDLWLGNMSLPPALLIRGVHESTNKTARIRALHRRYQAGNVVHLRELRALEQQQLDWPQVEHDDLVDVAARGVAEALDGIA